MLYNKTERTNFRCLETISAVKFQQIFSNTLTLHCILTLTTDAISLLHQAKQNSKSLGNIASEQIDLEAEQRPTPPKPNIF